MSRYRVVYIGPRSTEVPTITDHYLEVEAGDVPGAVLAANEKWNSAPGDEAAEGDPEVYLVREVVEALRPVQRVLVTEHGALEYLLHS